MLQDIYNEAYAAGHAAAQREIDRTPLRGSLSTVDVLSSLASYLHKAEGLTVDYCLLMALVILGVEHREDADVFVRAAKAQMGGKA
ncbi:hypothetical protein UFOVP1304_57 [uncultured Caudovirales phage]|uniref:Uncharacterized protein n=1 Tax=uncultured Caudovirales phage TaxID=2100421 RepID=A0A6J5RII3_9CAUD|nr:hypothetical protein UFOVP1304_57 [uncultured Caudovirales phage]